MRLPNSSRLRPTTLQECAYESGEEGIHHSSAGCPLIASMFLRNRTITPIVVKHTLRLTVYHSVWGQDAKGQSLSTGRCRTMRQVQVSHPVTILPVSRKRARALSLSLSSASLWRWGIISRQESELMRALVPDSDVVPKKTWSCPPMNPLRQNVRCRWTIGIVFIACAKRVWRTS